MIKRMLLMNLLNKIKNWFVEPDISPITEEMSALDDLVEMYSKELERNQFQMVHYKQSLAELEKRNEILNSKIASTIRRIEELKGDRNGSGNSESDNEGRSSGQGD